MGPSNGLIRYCSAAAAVFAVAVGWSSPSHAFIEKFVVDQVATVNFTPLLPGTSTPGPATSYTVYQGRIFGNLQGSALDQIVTDINLAAPVAGQYAYIANFQIVTPTDPAKRNGLLIYGVSNRGGSAVSTGTLQQGVTYVQSGWQGDLLSECSLVVQHPYPCFDLSSGPYGTLNTTTGAFSPPVLSGLVPGTTNLTSYVIQVPIATSDGQQPNGSNTITGQVYSHVAPGTSGHTAQLIISNSPSTGAAFTPYLPATSDTTKATLTVSTAQSLSGVDSNQTVIPSNAWSWANCPNGGTGTANPTWICLLNNANFDPNKLYEIVFTAANPLVLGVGYSATRDLVSFLRYGHHAPDGGQNPVDGTVTKAMIQGSSQSGAFIRGGIFYGFNQDQALRKVFDTAWPQIDGRMLWLNERWAQPTVLLQQFMAGDEAPVWWADFPNQARGLPANGLLHRCTATNSCPEILEVFGELEFYGEKMGPDLTGFCVVCTTDIPVPSNVHRYFYPGTSHGGSITANSFNWSAPPSTLPVNANQMFPSNPNGENFSNNALLWAFIQFTLNGTPMPPSPGGVGGTYPTIASGQLVANTAAATGFPSNIPNFPYGGNNAWPPMVYNFGPGVNYDQETGVISIQPPIVQQVLTPYVPHVNSDGNADGGALRSVLFKAPLGTYVGWNIIPPPSPYAGQQDSLSGGFWPFWDTKTNRTANNDPRPSLEERYGNHTGYVCVVTAAAQPDVFNRVLLVNDAQTLIGFAGNGNVLGSPFVPTTADNNLAAKLCVANTATHDFNGSNNSDIAWRKNDGTTAAWLMNGAQVAQSGSFGTVPTNWSLVGQRDFNGDGKYDWLWRDSSTGAVAIWLLNGLQVTQSGTVGAAPTNWTVAGTSDFNADFKGDILWRDTSSGAVAIWLMNGTQIQQAGTVGTVPLNWTIAGTDGRGKIIWRDGATGTVAVWVMNGLQVSQSATLGAVPSNWTIIGTGDFDGNGSTDILWRDTTTGTISVWLMNGLQIQQTGSLGALPANWTVAETGDFDGDGHSDILWRDTSSGTVALWLMNGLQVTSSTAVGAVTLDWTIQGSNVD